MKILDLKALDKLSYATLGRFVGIAEMASWGTVDAGTIMNRLVEVLNEYQREKLELEK